MVIFESRVGFHDEAVRFLVLAVVSVTGAALNTRPGEVNESR